MNTQYLTPAQTQTLKTLALHLKEASSNGLLDEIAASAGHPDTINEFVEAVDWCSQNLVEEAARG